MKDIMISNRTVSWSVKAVTDVTNYVYPSIDLVIAVLIIIGNAFVITAYLRFERLRTDVNLIIANLSCADLLVALAVIICRLTLFFNHHSSDEVLLQNCLLKIALALVSVCASIFFLLLMTTERYLKILHPFQYERLVTHGRIIVAICLIWISTVSLGFVLTYPWHIFEPAFVCLPTYVLPLAVQKFVLPPVVIIFLGGMLLMYGRIIYVAQSQRRQISDMKKRFQSNPEECKKTDYRLTVMLAYVTGFLTLTYIPLVVVFIFGAHLNTVMYWDDYVPEELLVFAVFERLVFSCVFMNSLINPIIYHFKNPEFRRAFRQMCGARKVAAQDTSVTDTHRSTLATDIATTTNGGSFMDLPRA